MPYLFNPITGKLDYYQSVAGTDHGSLSGLLDDDHTQYLLLAGRGGGQVGHGGAATGENLTFRSNAVQDGLMLLGDDVSKDERVVIHGDESEFTAGVFTYPARLAIHGSETQIDMVEVASTYSDIWQPTYASLRSRGTDAAPAKVDTGDILWAHLHYGRTGPLSNQYAAGALQLVEVDSLNFGVSNNRAAFVWLTDGSERLRIGGDGRVTVAGSGLGVNGLPYVWPGSQAANRVLKTDGSSTLSWGQVAFSELTGSLTHSSLSGIGANDHHNQSHVLATTAGLGADHTVSGLTAGQVLRASGATAAAFAALAFSDLTGSLAHSALTGLSADDHAQYLLLAGRSGGQTANGGTATSDHLDLYANANAWSSGMTGRIQARHQITFPDNWTLTNTLAEALIEVGATYTLPNGANALYGYHFHPLLTYSAQQVLSVAPGMLLAPTIQPTATLADNLTLWSAIEANPHYLPTAAGCTTPQFYGMTSRPDILPSVAVFATNVAAYAAFVNDVFNTNHFNANVTSDLVAGFMAHAPGLNGAAVTDLCALYVANYTGGTRNSSILSPSSVPLMRHVGAAKFGGAATDTPSAQMHVAASAVDLEVTRFESATSGTPAVVSEVRRQGRVTTTNNTVTTLMSYTLTAGRAYLIEARVVAHRTGGSAGAADDSAAYVVYAGAKHTGGAAALITAVGADYTDEDQAGWAATIDANGNNVRVRVTGATNNNITWHCTLIIHEVGS